MSQQTVWIIKNTQIKRLFPLGVDEAISIMNLPDKPPFALVLSKNSQQNWIDLLKEIRSRASYRFTPVYYHDDVPPHLRHLFAGPADDNLINSANKIYERIHNISPLTFQSPNRESILLAYLYSRPHCPVKGYKSDKSPFVYDYPLLNILFKDNLEVDNWKFLESLVTRNLLAHSDVIDEIETCPACDSGLLNLRKSCPNCRSTNFKPQQFVHCFACGQIAPVPEFLRQERLICSNCHIKLEAPGVDYEKPIENKLCNACGHFFAEPILELVCLSCHRTSASSEFIRKPLYDYHLTRQGEYVVLGIENSFYASFGQYFKMTDYPVFLSILNWYTKLSERYGLLHFSVMMLQIDVNNREEVKKEQSSEFIGKIFTNLRQVIRESDLASRLDESMLFLLPFTKEEGCMIVLNRLQHAGQELVNANENLGLTIKVSYMASNEILSSALQGEFIMAELKIRMQENNLCIAKN
ncbi:hypothetical protein ACQUW5_00565 [Legionella sp. CNM-1927-20]|uniref:TackOD1 domain-containing metal-binding protein n=1 Tax=Legionella sp. CNM-1927-20 TaxID=3422221 RepID=UPI00403AD722